MCWKLHGCGGRQFCSLHRRTWPQNSVFILPVHASWSLSEQLCHLSHLHPVVKLKFWIHGFTIAFMATDCSIIKQYGDDLTSGGKGREGLQFALLTRKTSGYFADVGETSAKQSCKHLHPAEPEAGTFWKAVYNLWLFLKMVAVHWNMHRHWKH